MASFNELFHNETPAAINGETYQEGDVVVFSDRLFAATSTQTLSNPVTLSDFNSNWIELGFYLTESGTGSAAGNYQFRIVDNGGSGQSGFITFVRE